MPKLRITAGAVSLRVETRDTPTAAAILGALPIRSAARIWAAALDDVRTLAKVCAGAPVTVERAD
ncbi:MAG: hypothetical protein ACFCUT_03180 [Kiloniellaceae bacterium]